MAGFQWAPILCTEILSEHGRLHHYYRLVVIQAALLKRLGIKDVPYFTRLWLEDFQSDKVSAISEEDM